MILYKKDVIDKLSEKRSYCKIESLFNSTLVPKSCPVVITSLKNKLV